uniref:Uncharacterized protein n=1 Tax=Rhizophora mucronata TaxID=61149 RepID=A0A2P2R0Y4_RHIMU
MMPCALPVSLPPSTQK